MSSAATTTATTRTTTEEARRDLSRSLEAVAATVRDVGEKHEQLLERLVRATRVAEGLAAAQARVESARAGAGVETDADADAAGSEQ